MDDNSDSDQEGENHIFEGYKPGLIECLKLTAEINGAPNLSEELFEDLYENCNHILKLIIQQSIKFMDKNNHMKMTGEDMRLGIKSKGFKPVYGYISNEPIAYKHARAGGKEFFFVDDKEIDLNDFVNTSLPKVPLECSIKTYCVAVNGIPPKMKEKSLPQEPGATSSVSHLQNNKVPNTSTSKIVRKYSDKAMIKETVPHELSLEQQHYFIEITDACICSEESRRVEAIESLRIDTGLAPMLPRFSHFIFLGVKASVAQHNLALLIYLMRMCKAIVDNSSQNLQPYLHEIVPSILTCVTSRQLCLRPDVDNHWALRDFAASLLCQVCRTFNTKINRLQVRVCNYLSTILKDDSTPLATQYGGYFCLAELGTESITSYILPQVARISQKISSILDNSVGMLVVSNIDKNAADMIKAVLLKTLPSIIKQIKKSPDSLEDYQIEFGSFLGPLLYEAVIKLRLQALGPSQNIGQYPTSLVYGRSPLPVGTSRPQQNPQSQLIRVPSNPRNSFGGLMSPGTPARQNVVLIAPQQRLQPSAVGMPNTCGTPQLVRLIPSQQSQNPEQ